MNRGKLFEDQFRPQFSGHETFPLRYGWLKKVFDAVYSLELENNVSDTRDIFINDNAIARFGVGKNMVMSMRHWSTACNVIYEDHDKNIVTTDLARLLLSNDGLDPWMENASSIWSFHWQIAAKSSKATYLWLFNHFNNNRFDRAAITQNMLELSDLSNWKVAEATVRRDVECLVRAYSNKVSKDEKFTEEQIESPFAELGLIQPVNRNDVFQIRRGNQASLGNGIFLYALTEFWQQYTSESRTITLETIVYEPGSPGRVFCLDEDGVADRLYQIDKSSKGLFSWSETAGLRQVIANSPLSEIDPLELLKLDYVIE